MIYPVLGECYGIRLYLGLLIVASVQHPSTRPCLHLRLSLGRFWLFAPIAGYWLLAAVVVVLRPSVVLCARARQRERSD